MTDAFIAGRITDDDIDKLRLLIGYPNPTLGGARVQKPHYTVATPDAFRHFTNGYGDDNPLFCDEAYGSATRWCSQIGPPLFPVAATLIRPKTVPEDLRRQTKGALRGVHLFHSGTETHFYRPVFAGDRLEGTMALLDVEAKESDFSGGRSVITHNGGATVNNRGEVVQHSRNWFVHTEREGSASRGKNRDVELGHYTDEDLRRIDEAYEHEHRTGATPMWWEDVTVGAELPPVVKGPLTVRDVIAMHVGWGWGNYGIGALKIDYLNRKKMPGFYGKNEFGAWDSMQRLHWDPAFAQAIGNPTTYDYGLMRTCWVSHALTNFAGDDGWLFRMRTELRKFNFVGDTTWVVGAITAKRVDPELGPLVDLDVRCVNQRDETTVLGDATILLPSREHGPVQLPRVPGDVRALAPEPGPTPEVH